MSDIFSFVSVNKSYGGRAALEDFNLAIPEGETTVLIGPSGCGKSTVFAMMTGLLRPDSGTMFFEGEPVTELRLPSIRRRLGYVIQDGGLFPHLTGFGNVALMSQHLGWSRGKIDSRVAGLSKLTQLPEDLLARYPAEMSGGQRQRVSLMRALMLDPDVLLLDEPLGALDPMVRVELQDDLAAIFHDLRKTVVLVTHDLGEAAFFADRIVLMRSGRIVQVGAAADLFEQPAEAFVSQFVKAQRRGPAIGGLP